MNRYIKLVLVGLLVVAQCYVPLRAQNAGSGDGDVRMEQCERDNPHSGYGVDVTNFVSVPMCYIAGHNLFVVIDSIDNAVDIIQRPDFDSIHFLADEIEGRHDLQNILRPVSVGFCDGYVLVLASSQNDSSYLAVLDLNGDVVKRVDFDCRSYAFQIFPDEIIVAGKNALGYDINLLDTRGGIENMSADACSRVHYHKPKQSDRILESDPLGIGLTVVAVSVVFLALLCISLILKGYSKLILRFTGRRNKKETEPSKAETAPSVEKAASSESVDDDVYAAIAAAIYMYNEEMHDDESNVLTFRKTERSWTPWNAKYFNMNKYTGRNK